MGKRKVRDAIEEFDAACEYLKRPRGAAAMADHLMEAIGPLIPPESRTKVREAIRSELNLIMLLRYD